MRLPKKMLYYMQDLAIHPFFLEMGDDMSCQVQVCPPPKPYSKAEDFTVVKRELSSTLSIKGKHDALFIL